LIKFIYGRGQGRGKEKKEKGEKGLAKRCGGKEKSAILDAHRMLHRREREEKRGERETWSGLSPEKKKNAAENARFSTSSRNNGGEREGEGGGRRVPPFFLQRRENARSLVSDVDREERKKR